MAVQASDMEALRQKTERSELRARDAEARLRVIEAEIALIEKRKALQALRDAEA